jgi:hypothetical protein
MAASRFTSAYYVANLLVLASYAVARLAFEPAADPTAPGRQGRINTWADLARWERYGGVFLATVVAMKLWTRRSADDVAAQTFFYAKLFLALVAYLISPALLAWYCLAFWAVYALLPQPMADLAAAAAAAGGSTIIHQLTPTALREAAAATNAAWMVLFYAHAQAASVAAAPAFLEVANSFASPKLRFGAFDVTMWPRAAAELRVETSTWSPALPAVVLYERGREWNRLPPSEGGGGLPQGRRFFTKVSFWFWEGCGS